MTVFAEHNKMNYKNKICAVVQDIADTHGTCATITQTGLISVQTNIKEKASQEEIIKDEVTSLKEDNIILKADNTILKVVGEEVVVVVNGAVVVVNGEGPTSKPTNTNTPSNIKLIQQTVPTTSSLLKTNNIFIIIKTNWTTTNLTAKTWAGETHSLFCWK